MLLLIFPIFPTHAVDGSRASGRRGSRIRCCKLPQVILEHVNPKPMTVGTLHPKLSRVYWGIGKPHTLNDEASVIVVIATIIVVIVILASVITRTPELRVGFECLEFRMGVWWREEGGGIMVHVPSDMACICYEIVICRNTPLLKAILELSSRVLGPCSSLLFYSKRVAGGRFYRPFQQRPRVVAGEICRFGRIQPETL